MEQILKNESIIELASLLTSQTDFHEVLRLVTNKAADLLNADTALIMMINPKTRETIKTIYKEGNEPDNRTYQFFHTYLSGWVIENNSGILSENIKEDQRFNKKVTENMALKSVMCVPFRIERIIIGTILLQNPENGAVFSKNDYAYLENLTLIVSPYLRNIQKIEEYFTTQIPDTALINKYAACGLLGKSKRFVELLRSVDAAANCDVRILLEGASGTGKEIIARAIHNFSQRSTQKFIAIDCGAIPEHLIESELFGHTKGAFTGAMGARTGLFEEANNGTLFMDEISNLPVEMQVKLLRVLQEGEIRPLGSNTIRRVNVRIISASSTPLKELVSKQKFREDLFYRLMVYPVHIPSLQERHEDIPLLAGHFLKRFTREQNKEAESFHEEIIDYMKHHAWTGNIRELENFVERMVAIVPRNQKQIATSALPREFQNELGDQKKKSSNIRSDKSLPQIISEYESKIIRQALVDSRWNQSVAANKLGIDESTLRYKITKYGLKKKV
jgi:Nif-specific regulatory protein